MAHVVDTTYGRNRDLGQVTDPALLAYYASLGYTIDGTTPVVIGGTLSKTVTGIVPPYSAANGEVVTVQGGQFITAAPTGGGGGGGTLTKAGIVATGLAAADIGAEPAGTATAAVAAVINAAPSSLDTLKELADALGDDANFAATITNALGGKAPLASPAFTGTPTVNGSPIGSSGGTLTATAVKTSAYTAGGYELVPVDATSAAVTITLPTAPADKTRVTVKKIDATGNGVTITRGGTTDVFNAAGGSTSITLTVQHQAATFQYAATGAIWYAVAADIPLSQVERRQTFDPRNYGTVDTTGATSSLAAIQAACDACGPAGGGVVVFAAGTLLLSNTLNITSSNVTLRGKGRGTLLKIAGAVASLHVIAVQGTQASPIRGVEIENLRWQGYGDNAGVTASSHGLYVRWCDWMKITDVWAHDCTFAAIRIDDSEHAIIDGVTVEQGTLGINGGWYGVELGNFTKGQGARGYSGYHVLTNVTTHVPEHSIAVYLCDDVTIDQATATGNQNDYAYNWTGAQRIVMTNFAIHTNGGGYLYLEWDQTLGTSRGCQHVRFAHGVCTGLVNAPDQFSGGSGTPTPSDLLGCYFTSSPDTTLDDILFDCSGQALVTTALHGIQTDANSPRLRVSDCTIVSPLGDGIRIASDGNTFRGVRVVSPRGATSTNGGINLSAGQYNLVQGCRVESGAQHGILANSTYSTIADNYVTGCAGDGIRLSGGTDCRIAGNTTTGHTGWGVNVQSGARTRIHNNFAQTNTAGNYTTAATGHFVDVASNKGMNDLAAKSSSATLGQFDHIWVVDATAAARTITLPAANAVPAGREYVVKCKAGSTNNVTLTAAGADTIDGTATLVLTAGQVARVRSDGTSLWNAL